jgi:glycosyltransferase involved in cell wall biosynthesis
MNASQSVTVIMPAYNAEKTLLQSALSVLNQTNVDIELIIINDGSRDNTQAIIDDLQHNHQHKVTSIPITNHGVSYARNLGIKQARHTWIAFCDADDTWYPEKLSKQLALCQDHNWSYTDSYYVGDGFPTPIKRSAQSALLDGFIYHELLKENFLTTSSILVKKELLTAQGGFDEQLAALEDWDLWLVIAAQHPIVYVSEPLLDYLVYPGSTSRKAREMLPLHEAIINKHHASVAGTMYREALTKSYSICSYIAEDSHDYFYALVCSAKAYKVNPLSLKLLKRLIRTSLLVLSNGKL